MRDPRHTMISEDAAQTIAIAALAHVANDEALLTRFMSVTGVEPSQIRHSATEPGFLAGVLDFLLGHEPDAVAFANENGFAPDDVLKARAALAGNTNPDPWQSI